MQTWKKVVINILFTLAWIICSGAFLAWFVMYLIPINAGSFGEVSYWDVLSSKALYNILKADNPNLNLPIYHFYYKMLVFLFMAIGFTLDVLLVKWHMHIFKPWKEASINMKVERQYKDKDVQVSKLEERAIVLQEKIDSNPTKADIKELKKINKQISKLSK